jgi:sugar-specific transcriptional regulator TrmB
MLALFLMLAEKRRLHDYRCDLKEKKDDLIKVIEDAEELITEMNRYSDYVITQIEEKHSSLTKTIDEAEIKLELFEHPRHYEMRQEITPYYDEEAIDKIIEEDFSGKNNYTSPIKKGKVLTFDVKRREITKLAKSGLDSTEIARLLNCGKGEIELIARMGR